MELRFASALGHHDCRRVVGVPQVGSGLTLLVLLRVQRARRVGVFFIARAEPVVGILRPRQVHGSRQHDASGSVAVVAASREVWVISADGGAAHDDGVGPRALRPDLLPRCGTRDPRAVPRGCRDLSVDGHGVLEDAERPARGDSVK